ncbi:hypothetical protein BJF92_13625 [Rhizobium rhizosphaerae]|uniref:Uncharacterized protein n=1 Tax=Xaviernesmea rhizosphaerae TaxID=1672749 RepID=A0A1Q9AI14_9HYPH|nr:hypothetical protein [Xaviernesmea rhizosphaerae]OLP54844.1 hypothetical protein BJF92_13625 [Xaviernesmea rhizosphaerae]
MTSTIIQAAVVNRDSDMLVGIGCAATVPDGLRNAMLSYRAERASVGEFAIEVYEVEFGSPLNNDDFDPDVIGVLADAA